MENTMVLFTLRYFVVQTSQTLFPLEELEPKELFTYPLVNKHETVYYGKKYTFRVLSTEDNNQYIMGYLLKSKDTHLISLQPDLFDEEDIPNWERLFFTIDTLKQLFICQINSNIASPNNVKNVLDRITNQFAAKYGYYIKLEYIIDEFKFWDIIKTSDGLYQIAFDLNAPNLFGGSKKANEWMSLLKQRHNMTHVSVDFRNEKGELTYDSEELESYRDYADSGGGHWTLGAIKQGRKKRYISADHIRKKEIKLESDLPSYFRTHLRSIRNQIVEIFNSIV